MCSVLALAYVMNLSGQTITLGTWVAGAGGFFAFLSPIVGWFGTAVTGSDTSSNSLFGALQVAAAHHAHLSPTLLAGANSSGGVMAKMVSPQNLAIGAAAVGLAGREGDIFRKVIGWSILFVLIMALLVLLQSSGALSWMVPNGSRRNAAAAIAVAALIELGLRLTPSFDPYGWLVWGRLTLHGALDTGGAPSWKPLPWLLTTPLALTGGAAPALWLIVTCAAGLVALLLAYRLASMLAGPVAGVTAVVALLLCHNWCALMLTGNVEPATTALVLGALDRHLAGRRRTSLALLCLASLMRPECGVILVAYGAWLWRRDPGVWRLESAAAALLVLLWFLPPYLATGHFFGAKDAVFNSENATHNPLVVIYRGARIVPWPVLIAAALGLWLVMREHRFATGGRRGIVLALVAGAAAWSLGAAAMAAAGFPGVQRFMIPAAGAGCVVAGAGVGWSDAWIRDRLRARRSPLLLAGVALVVAGIAVYGVVRINDTRRSIATARANSSLDRSLHSALVRAGGSERILACGLPTAAAGFQSPLAWDLHLAVGRVLYRPSRDVHLRRAIVLFADRTRYDRLGRGGDLLARYGPWRVIALRAGPGC